jgi:hypothetical protein
MLPSLYDRYCVVVVGGVRIEGLRIQFRAQKAADTDPNVLDLHIFNLAQDTRDWISSEAPNNVVWVDAGYKDSHGQVFAGDVASVSHVKRGADWDTHIMVGDNLIGLTTDTVNQTYGQGTQVADGLHPLLAAMSVDTSQAQARLGDTSNPLLGGVQAFARPFTAVGSPYAALDTIAKAQGFKWALTDGKLLLYKDPEVVPQNQFTLLSSASGLLTSPDTSPRPNPRTGLPVVRSRALMMPQLQPLAGVRMNGMGRKGDFRIARVVHSGDTHGAEWYSDIELETIGG